MRLFAALTLLLGAVSTWGVAGVDAPSVEEAADAVAAQALRDSPGGLVIGVSWGHRPAFVRGYGDADIVRKVPVTADTVFPICSISKNFAAAAVLKLSEQGRVELDTPV